jgi:pyruvate dehydrogenase E1 component
LLGAGTILNEVLAAAELLEHEWNIGADVYSVTSFTELRREGMGVSRNRLLAPRPSSLAPCWIETQLPANGIPVVAASDYVSAVADLIRPWIRDPYVALGTDGFGRSDTRANLRRFFGVDRHSLVVAALSSLDQAKGREAIARYGIDAACAPPWAR